MDSDRQIERMIESVFISSRVNSRQRPRTSGCEIGTVDFSVSDLAHTHTHTRFHRFDIVNSVLLLLSSISPISYSNFIIVAVWMALFKFPIRSIFICATELEWSACVRALFMRDSLIYLFIYISFISMICCPKKSKHNNNEQRATYIVTTDSREFQMKMTILNCNFMLCERVVSGMHMTSLFFVFSSHFWFFVF